MSTKMQFLETTARYATYYLKNYSSHMTKLRIVFNCKLCTVRKHKFSSTYKIIIFQFETLSIIQFTFHQNVYLKKVLYMFVQVHGLLNKLY